jgi:hypothetical protein
MAAGLVAFVRGLNRFRRGAEQPFPWMAVSIAAAIPFVGMAGLVGYAKWRDASRRADARAAVEAVEAAKAADAKAVQDRAQAAQAAAAARAASEAEVQERTARVERFQKLVRNPNTGWQGVCDSALALGSMGAREAIPDLQARLADASEPGLQNCAATALVQLGDVDGPLAFFLAASSSPNDDLVRMAITGFGKIGPAAGPAALSFLTAQAQSPDSTHRYLAVESLSKMGADAVPALKAAAGDSDAMVKQKAEAALAQMGQR